MKLPILVDGGRGAVLKLKSVDGRRVEVSAGIVRIDDRTTRVLSLQVVGRVTDVTSIERTIGAGAGAAVGLLGGPVLSVVGAGLGVALAGRRSALVRIVGEDGLSADLKMRATMLERLELAAGVVAR